MPRPKLKHIYEVHWIDIESKGDWNEDPDTTSCPTHVNFWWLVRAWNRKELNQVFCSTLALEGKTFHDHQLIPTGAIVLVADLLGNVVWKHPKYSGKPITV